MAGFNYKATKTTKMQLKGVIDTDEMTIDIDEETKNLKTLLQDFNGAFVDMSISIKTDEELEEPIEYLSDEVYED